MPYYNNTKGAGVYTIDKEPFDLTMGETRASSMKYRGSRMSVNSVKYDPST